ncbi:hypothetical protein CR513_11138, partial [Mucuna pruriens]
MAGKNKKCIKFSDSEDDEYEAEDSGTVLDLPLEKLNIGPRKKLLVMNCNGLLLHRVHLSVKNEIPKFRPADGHYRSFLVFKRPFSEEFMKFCLERFEVGIWSSAMEHNLDAALNYAIGPLRSKMLFVWDQRQCTDSGFKCLEKASKPLFFKEFNKIWENVKKGGPFNASNTLLIDDKPYKALLNPVNSAIFLEPYKADNDSDKALDPMGELCSYLKGVAEARDVQSYVKDHPYGQPAVTSAHSDWKFYSRVKESILKKRSLKNRGSTSTLASPWRSSATLATSTSPTTNSFSSPSTTSIRCRHELVIGHISRALPRELAAVAGLMWLAADANAVGRVAVLALDTLVDELLLDVPDGVYVVSVELRLLHPFSPFLAVTHRSDCHLLLFLVNGLHT